MSALTRFTPPVAAAGFFEIHFDGTNFRLFDLGKSRRSQSFGAPQYTGDLYATLAEAEAGVKERATDRGDL